MPEEEARPVATCKVVRCDRFNLTTERALPIRPLPNVATSIQLRTVGPLLGFRCSFAGDTPPNVPWVDADPASLALQKTEHVGAPTFGPLVGEHVKRVLRAAAIVVVTNWIHQESLKCLHVRDASPARQSQLTLRVYEHVAWNEIPLL